MIIKKFQAQTEAQGMELVKNDLGKDAIIMNIKTISPRGIYKLFRKPIVEITAAIDDNQTYKAKSNYISDIYSKDKIIDKNDEIEEIEEKLNNLQSLFENQLNNYNTNNLTDNIDKKDDFNKLKDSINFEYIQLIYNQLIVNEVDHKYASQILSEIENTIREETPLDTLLAGVYQKIVLKLGNPQLITPIEGKTKFIFFVGSTGVGKTTTQAKIASYFKLNKKLKIGFINLDTYRIAATHQLMTYADILNVPFRVVYSPDEMKDAVEEFKDYDLVFVDTAGRSHKARQKQDDLIEFLNKISPDCLEVYLVLSITTKYNDLIRITEVYKDIAKYSLIFTKFDETSGVGNILNIRMLTNAPLSYVTFGQGVPEDFMEINPQSVAKQLLREV